MYELDLIDLFDCSDILDLNFSFFDKIKKLSQTQRKELDSNLKKDRAETIAIICNDIREHLYSLQKIGLLTHLQYNYFCQQNVLDWLFLQLKSVIIKLLHE